MGYGNRAPAGRMIVLAFCTSLSPLMSAAVLAGAAGIPNSDNQTTVQLADLEAQFRAVADHAACGVVAISATMNASDADDVLRSDSMNGQKLQNILDQTTRTVGTGMVIDADGYILTNEHVVGEAGQIWVTTDTGKVYPAVIVGSDPRADLAVLKVPVGNLTPVEFADPASIKRGMWAIALGNPYGLANTGQMSMSVGIVSATERSLPKLASQENRQYDNLIQTTAEINPGNSGGPLFNVKGEVIGLSTAVILPQKSTNGIGFAMPISPQLVSKIRDLKDGREIVYGYLGVMVSNPTGQQRREAGIAAEAGALIDTIEQGAPADKVLLPGDVAMKLNDQLIPGSDEFVRMIGSTPVDQPARILVRRKGQPITLTIKLRRRELPSVAVNRENQRIRWRGMLLGPIPTHWDFGPTKRPEHGLMILGVDPASPMSKQGVRSGEVITAVAGKPLRAVTDLQNILNSTPAEQCSLELAPLREAVVSGQ